MPAKNSINILGLEVDNSTINDVLENLKKVNSKKKKIIQITTVNPEIVILAKENPEYKKILNGAQIRVADGIGIILAGKILGKNFKERITGLALTKKLCELSAKEGLVIGLIGGRDKIAVRTGECLQKLYPKLKWWGERGPNIKYQRSNIKDSNKKIEQFNNGTMEQFLNTNLTPHNFNNLVRKINQTRTSILFCAFGAPKQEYFISELRRYESKLDQPLLAMGVGGVFDELSGTVSPAPQWIDNISLKWFWRLIHEPWRWKRQLRLLKFLYLILTA